MYIGDYRKLNIDVRKKIYNAYVNIIDNLDINNNVRNKISGMIYENENFVYTFKLYNPANYQDNRLIYEPIEIMKIGKNKKTGIPVKTYGLSSGYNFNLIDSDIYDTDVYESNIIDSEIVFDSNA
jgi:hypothetical protein